MAENTKLSATLRAHDLMVQTLRTRIAKLQKQAFGKSSEKIEREIEQLELALEDLQVAMAGLDWEVPDFRTLCRCQKMLNVAIPYRGGSGRCIC